MYLASRVHLTQVILNKPPFSVAFIQPGTASALYKLRRDNKSRKEGHAAPLFQLFAGHWSCHCSHLEMEKVSLRCSTFQKSTLHSTQNEDSTEAISTTL